MACSHTGVECCWWLCLCFAPVPVSNAPSRFPPLKVRSRSTDSNWIAPSCLRTFRLPCGSYDGAHRHIWLALCALARRVLSQRSAPEGRTGIRGENLPDHRNQRHILFSSAPGAVRPMEERETGRFHLRSKRATLHYPYAQAEKRKAGACEFLRVGRAQAGAQAWSDPVATAAADAVRCGQTRSLLRSSAARHACGGAAGARSQCEAQSARLAPHRHEPQASTCIRNPPRQLLS